MNHSNSHHSRILLSCYDGGASNRSGLALYSIHHRGKSQRCPTHQRNQTNSQSRHREILRYDRKIRHNQLGSLNDEIGRHHGQVRRYQVENRYDDNCDLLRWTGAIVACHERIVAILLIFSFLRCAVLCYRL